MAVVCISTGILIHIGYTVSSRYDVLYAGWIHQTQARCEHYKVSLFVELCLISIGNINSGPVKETENGNDANESS